MKIRRQKIAKEKCIFCGLVVGFIFFIVFFLILNNKKIKFGNNESNKSVEQVKQYIFIFNSYTAEMEVTVNSNKNVNKYMLKQCYNINNISEQTVVKPENIEGVTISYKDGNLEIENSNLNLSKIYNNYPYLSDNLLWLSSFCECCKKDSEHLEIYEENDDIVMELKLSNNKYFNCRKLYLEKGTGKPRKMVVQDNNKKDAIYILYKEIKINN